MKKMLALVMAMTMGLGMTACGGSEKTEEPALETAAEEGAANAEGQTYTVGICQLVQHVALDAATQGFKDAITEAASWYSMWRWMRLRRDLRTQSQKHWGMR